MGTVGYWFAWAGGTLMFAAQYRYGSQMPPALVDALFWGSVAIITICALVTAWKGWNMIRNIKVSGCKDFRKGGHIVRIEGDVEGLSLTDNLSTSVDGIASVTGNAKGVKADRNIHLPGGAHPKPKPPENF